VCVNTHNLLYNLYLLTCMLPHCTWCPLGWMCSHYHVQPAHHLPWMKRWMECIMHTGWCHYSSVKVGCTSCVTVGPGFRAQPGWMKNIRNTMSPWPKSRLEWYQLHGEVIASEQCDCAVGKLSCDTTSVGWPYCFLVVVRSAEDEPHQ